MLQTLRNRASRDEGFTLVELLVVILIIGILAAIALPTFLGQQTKGQDASAKSDVRNLVSHVESCYADSQDYTACNTAALLGVTGLSVDAAGASPASGKVAVKASTSNTYTIEATSKSGNHFRIARDAAGVITKTCDAASTGGCKAGGVW